jgi:pimeloyl-ACP methyl ester carboxylesterase
MRTTAILRDGARLIAEDTGGEGIAAVFQHGLGGDALQAAEAFPDDAGFRRLTLECRGHGRSEAADLVRALVLARPAWVVDAAPSNMAPTLEIGRLLQRLPPLEARAAFEASETARQLALAAPDNLATLLGFFDRPAPDITAALLTTISLDGPQVSAEEVRALRVPTLIIATGRDRIHPVSHAEELAGMIRGARLTRITSKSDDRARYVADMRATVSDFLATFA